MKLQQFIMLVAITLLVGLGSAYAAEKLTTPTESLNGLRPGTLTLGDLTTKYGKPAVTDKGSLLKLYGGSADSTLYGWFMVENPNYTVPDLAVETAKGSDRIDLVMAIGYDGLKTEKGVACFDSEARMLEVYGKPDFVFAVPMDGFVLREFYYVKLGISFDVAPVNQAGDRQIVAIYVTYPEFLTRAIDLRKQYIRDGTGQDITSRYQGGIAI
ncbi:MAG TPA: hypothetical protein VHV83_07175 [Armatimonadota bacterium]|nr:hypothetical protein [Armatimonadota bacterium]